MDNVVEYERVHPVSRKRAVWIGVWVGWGVDSIVTDLWPWLTGHTVELGIRDLAIAGLIWFAAYARLRSDTPPLREVLRSSR